MKNVYVCVRVCECVSVGVRVCQGVKTERERETRSEGDRVRERLDGRERKEN